MNVLVEDEAGIFPLAANQTRSLHLLFHIYFRPNQPLHTKRNNQPHQPSTYQSHVNNRPHHTVRSTTYHYRILTSLPLATALPFSLRHRKQTETSPTPILLLKSQWPSPLVYEGIGEEGTPDPVGHTTPILIGAWCMCHPSWSRVGPHLSHTSTNINNSWRSFLYFIVFFRLNFDVLWIFIWIVMKYLKWWSLYFYVEFE